MCLYMHEDGKTQNGIFNEKRLLEYSKVRENKTKRPPRLPYTSDHGKTPL